jgi:hypothetical protein
MLRKVIAHYKDHPANGGYKGADEPPWGKEPVEPVRKLYEIVRSIDPDHPVIVMHAPLLSPDVIAPYIPWCDITGADIFPISYPPQTHSDDPNKNISVVGDITKKMMRLAGGKKSVWMTLQIAFSGTVKPQKTLRFPTWEQERYMTYQAIANGARGINYFGGEIQVSLNERDAKLGWNWTFWQRTLRPIIEEIGEKSPLYPALVAADSKLPIKVPQQSGIEFVARQVENDLFIIATKREGATTQVTFSGLPLRESTGEVLFESPRKVTAKDGQLTDWFAPFDVHVYRFHLAQ